MIRRGSHVMCRFSLVRIRLCRCKIPLAHASSTRSQPVGLTACVSVYLRVWVAVGVCGCTTAEYRARAPGRLKSGGHCTRELALTHGRTVAAATETHAQAHELYMQRSNVYRICGCVSVYERAWAKSHAHRVVFHPLFLPRLSSARLFRQARSCTSRVKTVPNAARSSGKTSFQLLPVFPTAATVFNGSIVDQLFFISFIFFGWFL